MRVKRPIIMTLLVRDEVDVVRTNIEYHLSRGVSHIFATDNLSEDGTTEVLKEYEQRGVLTYMREEADTHDQAVWVTRMARVACRSFPGGIIFHVDADEFWWPMKRSLADTLNGAFADFDGMGQVHRVNYIGPNVDADRRDFLDRCGYRQTVPTNALGMPLPGKVCHPASLTVAVEFGNHSARWLTRETTCRQIPDLEVLHYPNRSLLQFKEKTLRGVSAINNNPNIPYGTCVTWREMANAMQNGVFETQFRDQVVTAEDIRRRVAAGEILRCAKLASHMRMLRLRAG